MILVRQLIDLLCSTTRSVWSHLSHSRSTAAKMADVAPSRACCTTSSNAVKSDESLWSDTDQAQRLLMEQDQCILVDEQDRVIGKASKKDCHLMSNIDRGMLHRAFSVLLFNTKNECLLTQRASTKITFPDFYTNACCSHPLHTPLELEQTSQDPAIGVKRAAQRRLAFELGIEPTEIPLSDFRYITRILYKAPSNEGVWGEHEVDYILIIRKDVRLNPIDNEVRHFEYLNKRDFKSKIGK
jgi:isopentenyl-diphosphate delta-isomerase